jgi:hypothetical protein
VSPKQQPKKRKSGLLVWGTIAGLIALAILYWRCGGGFGIGGGDGLGGGKGDTVRATSVDAGVRRCALRLSAAGLTVDGKNATQAEAVEVCKAAGGADIVVTGDARQGDWEALKSALDEAGVRKSLTEP